MQTIKQQIITITTAAQSEIKRRLEESTYHGLRLGVKGGGCSGLSYLIDVGDEKEGDYIMNQYGFKVFMDKKSTLYLKGTQLDYQGGFMGNGFRFINPNASNTCGCGESFSV